MQPPPCCSTKPYRCWLFTPQNEPMESKKGPVELKDAPSSHQAGSKQLAAIPLPDIHSLQQKQMQLLSGSKVRCCARGSEAAPQLHGGGGALIHPGAALDSQGTGTVTCQVGSGFAFSSVSSLKNVPVSSGMAGVASDLSGACLENNISSCPHFPCCGKLHFQSCHGNVHKLHQSPTHQSCTSSGYFPVPSSQVRLWGFWKNTLHNRSVLRVFAPAHCT